MNKISVVVPVYNVEKYLNQCVESLLNQTFDDFKIVLVDDGSPDNCPQMCDDWAKKDNRIKVIHKANGGLGSARNVGIIAAECEYTAFVDSDDWVEPEFLNTLYSNIIDYDADMVQCCYQYAFETGETIPLKNKNIKYEHEEIRTVLFDEFASHNLKYIVPSRCTKIYKTKLLRKAIEMCPESQVMGEDYILNFAYTTMCNRIVALETVPLYNYRSNNNSITHSYSTRKRLQERTFWQTVRDIGSSVGCTNLPDVDKKVQMGLSDAIYECCISNWDTESKKKEIREILSLITDKNILISKANDSEALKKICLFLVYYKLTGVFIVIYNIYVSLKKRLHL